MSHHALTLINGKHMSQVVLLVARPPKKPWCSKAAWPSSRSPTTVSTIDAQEQQFSIHMVHPQDLRFDRNA
jgi:hypothetical protein